MPFLKTISLDLIDDMREFHFLLKCHFKVQLNIARRRGWRTDFVIVRFDYIYLAGNVFYSVCKSFGNYIVLFYSFPAAGFEVINFIKIILEDFH